MSEQLIKSRMGRMILHAVCLLRHPTHAHGHWSGMVREFHSAARIDRARAG